MMSGMDLPVDEVLGTLRETDRRLRSLAEASTERVLDGSADRYSMAIAYDAIRGDVPLGEGIEALRNALAADGIDDSTIDMLEGLFLNAAMAV